MNIFCGLAKIDHDRQAPRTSIVFSGGQQKYKKKTAAGWWFGTFFNILLLFHSAGNVIIPIDELIFFQRGIPPTSQPARIGFQKKNQGAHFRVFPIPPSSVSRVVLALEDARIGGETLEGQRVGVNLHGISSISLTQLSIHINLTYLWCFISGEC